MTTRTDDPIVTLPRRRKPAAPASAKARFTVKSTIRLVLVLQLLIAALLMGRDLFTTLPRLAWPSDQPRFDTPVIPGDQTRRYAPSDMPLAPAREGNPDRPFQSTGDMPTRLNLEQNGSTLVLTGQIAEGDAERLSDFLDRDAALLNTVRLNSPGGSVTDALSIGRALRAAEVHTLLGAGDICLSACPYILAAGVERRVHDDAQVGVHQHYFGTNSALPAFLAIDSIQRGQGEVMSYLDSMGVDPLVMQHALVTPPDEIYVLLPEQLTDYALVTESVD